MQINRIWAVYFSPTGGTKEVVLSMAGQMKKCLQKEVIEMDYTPYENRKKVYHFDKNDIVIFGMPVYAGRVPNKILPDLEKSFMGEGTKLIPVSVYGNRNFDDALMELKIVLETQGFQTIAAAAIVSQHAFSAHLAADRPDRNDKEEIVKFIDRVAKRLVENDAIPEIAVMGNNPVKDYYTPLQEDGTAAKFLKAKPVTDMERCNHCGMCEKVCPMKSIDASDYSLVSGICIKCQACVKKCPKNAKKFVDEQFLSHVKMLERNYHRHGKNYFFEG